MSQSRPRAVAADVTPTVRTRLQDAGLDVTQATADDLLAQAETVDAQFVVVSRRSAVRALVAHAVGSGVTTGPPTGPHGLSERELDVLRLVATGKQNAEIARDLVISPKTVKNHVSRILNKLELRNRVEAAVFAVRQNIV